MLRPAKFFAASVLALAIVSAAVPGYKAVASVDLAYKQAVEIAQVLDHGRPTLKPMQKEKDLPDVPVGKFIFAFVTGADCVLNKVRRQPSDPWGTLQKQLGSFEWGRVASIYPPDLNIIPIVIKVPEAVWELPDLIDLLKRHSLFYSVDDGSGYFSNTNTFFGSSKG